MFNLTERRKELDEELAGITGSVLGKYMAKFKGTEEYREAAGKARGGWEEADAAMQVLHDTSEELGGLVLGMLRSDASAADLEEEPDQRGVSVEAWCFALAAFAANARVSSVSGAAETEIYAECLAPFAAEQAGGGRMVTEALLNDGNGNKKKVYVLDGGEGTGVAVVSDEPGDRTAASPKSLSGASAEYALEVIAGVAENRRLQARRCLSQSRLRVRAARRPRCSAGTRTDGGREDLRGCGSFLELPVHRRCRRHGEADVVLLSGVGLERGGRRRRHDYYRRDGNIQRRGRRHVHGRGDGGSQRERFREGDHHGEGEGNAEREDGDGIRHGEAGSQRRGELRDELGSRLCKRPVDRIRFKRRHRQRYR